MQCKRIVIDGCETNYIAYDSGEIYYELRNELVEPKYHNSKDTEVTLWFRGKPHVYILKDLIADCFIPNPYNLPYVKYIIEDPSNNSVHNLIRTASTITARVNYTPEQIHRACQLIAENKLKVCEIAKETNVSRHTIKRIKFYNGWVHIARQYGIHSDIQEKETVWNLEIRNKLKELYSKDMTLNSVAVAKILGVPVTRRFCLAARGVKLEVSKQKQKEQQNSENNE